MEEAESQVVLLSNRRPKVENQRVLKAKWRTSLDAGWTVVPSVLLRGLPRLHIDANGLAVLICLIRLLVGSRRSPWPSKGAGGSPRRVGAHHPTHAGAVEEEGSGECGGTAWRARRADLQPL